jgi:hypothetical protein
MVNEDFQLIYANPTFLNFMTEVSGEEKKLNESVFIAGFDEDYIVKWKNYYYRALKVFPHRRTFQLSSIKYNSIQSSYF